MGYDLGIDVGTTYTAAAIAADGRSEVLQLGTNSALMPSVVSIRDDGAVLVGDIAERRSVSDPARTVREFKRRVGDDAPYLIGGTPYRAEQFTGFVLANVLERASTQQGAAPRSVAIAHPADYGNHKLDRIRIAAEAAGIPTPLLVPEPVAVAVAYCDRSEVPVGAHLLIYDLGGGTFDAAVVRRDQDGPTLVAVEGLERLGGVDLDREVFEHIDRVLDGRIGQLDSNDPQQRSLLAQLRDEARGAKEALSADTDTQIPVFLAGAAPSVRLTRGEFEAMAQRIIDQTLPVIDRVVAGVGGWPAVHSVVLAGGSSRIPLVADRLRAHTDRPIAADLDPKISVAVGAATLAARAAGAGEASTPGPPSQDATSLPASAVATSVGSDHTAGSHPAPDDDTQAIPAAMPTRSRVSEHPAGSSRRGRMAIAVWVVIVVVVGAGAYYLFGRDAQTDDSTTTTTTTSERRSSTTATSGSGSSTSTGSPSTGAPTPTVSPTSPPTTDAPPRTAPTAQVTNLSAPTFVSCTDATNNGGSVTISWSAASAAGVNLAIDGPGVYESGLPAIGSTSIPATCGDTQTVTVTPLRADGSPGAASTITIEIGAVGT